MLTLSLLVLFKSAYIKNSYIQTMTLYIRLPGFKASDQFRSAHSCTLLAHLLIRATLAHLDSYASSHKYKPFPLFRRMRNCSGERTALHSSSDFTTELIIHN
ncbi:hypothetical protein HanPSC8_Chr13g0574111 [Helianthus annuus]|nr:hypothetical protein HanPSC8_Chr13g0574111 [Helianthus annuus]